MSFLEVRIVHVGYRDLRFLLHSTRLAAIISIVRKRDAHIFLRPDCYAIGNHRLLRHACNDLDLAGRRAHGLQSLLLLLFLMFLSSVFPRLLLLDDGRSGVTHLGHRLLRTF